MYRVQKLDLRFVEPVQKIECLAQVERCVLIDAKLLEQHHFLFHSAGQDRFAGLIHRDDLQPHVLEFLNGASGHVDVGPFTFWVEHSLADVAGPCLLESLVCFKRHPGHFLKPGRFRVISRVMDRNPHRIFVKPRMVPAQRNHKN